ncbi:MAG: deoxyguanosinetriphosphate triphosphohydrolase [Actinomycetota bacterium]
MVTISEETEQIERQILSPNATLASESKGRERSEDRDSIRTEFQRDRDRIVHCKAFRRLKHKTQVFLAPVGDHYRVRLTHTLEVAQVARTLARALRLNEDLTEAIALGHDLGHTPFGHIGEAILSKELGRKFKHAEQSLRVVEVLEYGGRGLNLTWETRDGILNHTWSQPEPATLEAKVVRFADRIAYLNHDLDDGVRAGVIGWNDVPDQINQTLGRKHSERIATLVQGVIDASRGQDRVEMTPEILAAMDTLRKFLFERVYLTPLLGDDRERAERIIHDLFVHYTANAGDLPQEFARIPGDVPTRVSDFIAGMTDGYAIRTHAAMTGASKPPAWDESKDVD